MMCVSVLRMASRSRWLTSEGFVFPGVPNSMQSNLHPKLPTRNRVEELNQVGKVNISVCVFLCIHVYLIVLQMSFWSAS